MYKEIFRNIFIGVIALVLIPGCAPDADLLAPDQVDISMVDTIVKVKGKITFASENPMGVGGMYLKIGGSKGEVDVRIQPDVWDNYTEDEKEIFREGRTVTVEGILFLAGKDLVVVHGKYTSPDTGAAPNSSD